MARDVLDKGRADFAILLPTTRGLVADPRELLVALGPKGQVAELASGRLRRIESSESGL